MVRACAELVAWLNRLDSYTNATYGRARTLAAVRLECVVCGRTWTTVDTMGRCRRCVAEQTADDTGPAAALSESIETAQRERK